MKIFPFYKNLPRKSTLFSNLSQIIENKEFKCVENLNEEFVCVYFTFLEHLIYINYFKITIWN